MFRVIQYSVVRFSTPSLEEQGAIAPHKNTFEIVAQRCFFFYPSDGWVWLFRLKGYCEKLMLWSSMTTASQAFRGILLYLLLKNRAILIARSYGMHRDL